MEPPEADPFGPPQFEFVNDHAFEADMATIVPNEKIRDDVIDDLGWTLAHAATGTAKPVGITQLPGSEFRLIITQKTGICPALRVVYSVKDEPPKKRWIVFHRAGLRDQNGSGL